MCVFVFVFFCFGFFDRLLLAKCLKIQFKIASLLSCLFVIMLILDHEVKLQFYGHYRKMLKDQNGLNSTCISWLYSLSMVMYLELMVWISKVGIYLALMCLFICCKTLTHPAFCSSCGVNPVLPP